MARQIRSAEIRASAKAEVPVADEEFYRYWVQTWASWGTDSSYSPKLGFGFILNSFEGHLNMKSHIKG